MIDLLKRKPIFVFLLCYLIINAVYYLLSGNTYKGLKYSILAVFYVILKVRFGKQY